MRLRKFIAISVAIAVAAMLFAITSVDYWFTLALLTALAMLSLDSLLSISFLGTWYLKLSIASFGAYHREVTLLALITYIGIAVMLAWHPAHPGHVA